MNAFEYKKSVRDRLALEADSRSRLEQDIINVLLEEDYHLQKVQVNRLMPIIKKWLEKAIDECSGYYTDTEYVVGKSKERFFKENNI